MASLEGFRLHAVIGPEKSDDELRLYLTAAEEYAAGAGVPTPETPGALYDLLVYRLAAHYDAYRSFPKEGDVDYAGINAMILQLRPA